MESPSITRFQVLVTHNHIHSSAVEFLKDNHCDVYFSPPYLDSASLAQKVKELNIDAIMVRQGQINADVINASSRLKVIVKHGVGVDNIDLRAAQSKNIPVLRSIGSNAVAVAEHTIALTLSLIKHIVPLNQSIKEGEWLKPSFMGEDITQKTIGLIGLGSIGIHVARMAQALNMQIIVFDPHALPHEHPRLKFVEELNDLLKTVDVVSLHCPLTPETRHLIDADQLSLMKPSSYLINTARGGLVNEAALFMALKEQKISGAALDSFELEPPSSDNPLWSIPNLIATPHIAGTTEDSAIQMANMAAQHIVSILQGKSPEQKSLCYP